jgi:hypothetical protein
MKIKTLVFQACGAGFQSSKIIHLLMNFLKAKKLDFKIKLKFTFQLAKSC